MHAELTTTHLRSAMTLYQRRAALLAQGYVPAATLRTLEMRLAGHALALAAALPTIKALPDKAAECYIRLAALLLARPEQAVALIVAELPTAAEDISAAVTAAWLTCAPDCAWQQLHEQCGDTLALRELLLGSADPVRRQPAFLAEALQQPALAVAALRYLGRLRSAPDIPLRHYYPDPATDDGPVAAAALYAGLSHQDPQAAACLEAFLQTTTTLLAERAWLNVVARPDYLSPALRCHAEQDPDAGLLLLALSGHKESAPLLLAALAEPRSAEPAAQAWQWLTGQALARQPRLQLVGEAGQRQSEQTLPDQQQAAQHWQQLAAQWPAGERRAWGLPITDAVTASLARQWAGLAGEVLLARCALQRPGLPFSTQWHHCRDRPLQPELPSGQEPCHA